MYSLSTSVSCVIALCCLVAHGQGEFLGDKVLNYKVIIEIPLYQCDILGRMCDPAILQVAEPGAILSIVGKTDDDSLIIRFWKWKENDAMNAELYYADSLKGKRKYFLMAACMMKNVVPRYDKKVSFTAGNVLIPVKMRLQKFDFSKDFTLGPVAGIKMRLSHYTRNCINFLAGLGVTSVTLNTQSTDGYIEEDIDVPALSPSIGAVFDFFSQTQAGLFIGWDFISNNDKHHFIYNGKTWLSFGLGFTILTKGSQITSVTDEQDN